jgi:hypothetical protein
MRRLIAVWPLALIACGGNVGGITLLDGSADDAPTDSAIDAAAPASDASLDAPPDVHSIPADGGFECGDTTCAPTDYCKHAAGGPAPGIDRYDCVPLPDACITTPTCECLALPLECRCNADSTHLFVRCDYP